ncbi:glycosyltransferase [Ruegeria sp. HKCCA5463]|uniref:glycosyltransferase n=1 Tax=Ruegeria sp. HKCCA5463 TaxID=2682994 RepID=UPI0014895479|nr:glycosyltransferase [Ruegeria sp. HKCCA5463]
MNRPTIVAMLATHARNNLLLQRALPSALSQSRPADAIIVVEDERTTDLAQEVKVAAPTAQFLHNRRTKGLSGALNTGLDHLVRKHAGMTDIFVAFLDDDDEWTPEHLAAVEARIREGAEVVAAPFLRLESDLDARRIDPPAAVDASLFMERNPGIQGSTFAAQLDILLEAGGFNEALQSCTDRDLWIRLCRRPNLRYATTSAPSVHHYACVDRPRLSSPGSVAKHSGLEMFDRIHGPLMSPTVRAKHLNRAQKLFDWQPVEGPNQDRDVGEEIPPDRPSFPQSEGTPPLIVGIIADDRRVQSLSRLLDDLAERVEAEEFAPPDVLLLENRPEAISGQSFASMVAQKRDRLRIRVVDRAGLELLERKGAWRPEGVDRQGRLAISDARTALQSCLYHMAQERPGCVVWILDDDMRLDPIIATSSGSERRPFELAQALRRMRATGADICIGTYTGAPPLPAVASIRGQLMDLLWNLRRLSASPEDAPVPAAQPHNAVLRAGRRDYYHDLSRIETDRLETPFALEPKHSDESCGDALARLETMIPRILAGEAPLRPLMADPDAMGVFEAADALHRGGNTFIFDPEALLDLPNISPTIGGRPTRRSDMIWALMHERRFDRQVISVPVPVRHDRSSLPPPQKLDLAGIADDVRGFAIFSALVDADEDPDLVEALCGKYEDERLAVLRLSFFRIRGLALELLDWIRNEAPTYVARITLDAQARQLLQMFSTENFAQIESAVRVLGPVEVRDFLSGMDARIMEYSGRVRRSNAIPQLLAEERGQAACASVETSTPIHVLGQGAEGVVFTDGRTIWKLFDRWTSEQVAEAVPTLRMLTGETSSTTALIKPQTIERTSLGWLMSLPFEASDPWAGGHGPGLVELLADLHRAGLVCRNLHPKNLRVANGSVRLIDYGADLIPVDDPKAEGLEFARMCRRAWLCWRWWWRSDIGLLMRQSLHDVNLPELEGHENLIRAVRERLGLELPVDPTVTRALALRPKRVLDYGAGKGKQAATLARAGAKVVAWDPDPGVETRLDELASLGVHRAKTAAEAITSGPFDLVVCRRVACLLDEDELGKVLTDLRAALATDGRVLFALCHPAYAHRSYVAEATPLSTPGNHAAAEWTKTVRATGRVLHERHRSERLLRRRLMRSGFRIMARHERRCIEFERFETVSDLLVLELAPASKPDVSLLIKACAMDAEALDLQLRDILAALEHPGVFNETVLALDTRREGFPRPHAEANLSALRNAAQRLLNEGEIDRIVETPSSPTALRALNFRWFGLDLAASHSAGGAATGALLAGFDACIGPNVLHADIDMMIARTDRNRDPVSELVAALREDSQALTASFPVAHEGHRRWTATGSQGPWRVESRLGLVCLKRMNAILPLPNTERNGAPDLSWHRAMDEAVRLGRGTSLRGGCVGGFCLHPPNARKRDIEAWEEVRASVARGRVPTVQVDQIEWTGGAKDWRQAERHERFVFVICGHNVTPERFRRCWDSVLRQDRQDWGAIVVDDASVPWIAEEVGHMLSGDIHRVSFVARRRRAGLLANTVHAIRDLCATPGQIIVTLDADDQLIGRDVLTQLANAYDAGADLTVGSMLRTDKSVDYKVCFDNPRGNRGGNVWQHLRSFRKGLFDGVPDEALRLDGSYVELASDWAFMLPMVEAARAPIWIRKPLYLHEPGETRETARAAMREAVIARLIARETRIEEEYQ